VLPPVPLEPELALLEPAVGVPVPLPPVFAESLRHPGALDPSTSAPVRESVLRKTIVLLVFMAPRDAEQSGDRPRLRRKNPETVG
jgi:hypothetical protein